MHRSHVPRGPKADGCASDVASTSVGFRAPWNVAAVHTSARSRPAERSLRARARTAAYLRPWMASDACRPLAHPSTRPHPCTRTHTQRPHLPFFSTSFVSASAALMALIVARAASEPRRPSPRRLFVRAASAASAAAPGRALVGLSLARRRVSLLGHLPSQPLNNHLRGSRRTIIVAPATAAIAASAPLRSPRRRTRGGGLHGRSLVGPSCAVLR